MQGSKSHGRRNARHAGSHRTSGHEHPHPRGSGRSSGVQYPEGSFRMVREYVEESPRCDSVGVRKPKVRTFESDAMRAFGEQEVRRLSNELRKLILYTGCLCAILAPLLLRSLSATSTANNNSALAATASSLLTEIQAQYAALNRTSPFAELPTSSFAHLTTPPRPNPPDHCANTFWMASIATGLVSVLAGAVLRRQAPRGIHHSRMDQGARAVRAGAWTAVGLYVAGLVDLARAVGMRLGGISAFLGATAIVMGVWLGVLFVARARERPE